MSRALTNQHEVIVEVAKTRERTGSSLNGDVVIMMLDHMVACKCDDCYVTIDNDPLRLSRF